MRTDFPGGDDSPAFFDVPLRKPSKVLFIGGLVSVCVGIIIGLLGLISIRTASNSQEYELGFLGYLLTALIPIILLQLMFNSHKKALTKNHDEPYDIYAGNVGISRFKKIVFIGLITASIPIWVFFYPIAEIYA
jgi:ABC-type arginine transport system permease subunit